MLYSDEGTTAMNTRVFETAFKHFCSLYNLELKSSTVPFRPHFPVEGRGCLERDEDRWMV